jgi:hypothetical protein
VQYRRGGLVLMAVVDGHGRRDQPGAAGAVNGV